MIEELVIVFLQAAQVLHDLAVEVAQFAALSRSRVNSSFFLHDVVIVLRQQVGLIRHKVNVLAEVDLVRVALAAVARRPDSLCVVAQQQVVFDHTEKLVVKRVVTTQSQKIASLDQHERREPQALIGELLAHAGEKLVEPEALPGFENVKLVLALDRLVRVVCVQIDLDLPVFNEIDALLLDAHSLDDQFFRSNPLVLNQGYDFLDQFPGEERNHGGLLQNDRVGLVEKLIFQLVRQLLDNQVLVLVFKLALAPDEVQVLSDLLLQLQRYPLLVHELIDRLHVQPHLALKLLVILNYVPDLVYHVAEDSAAHKHCANAQHDLLRKYL